MFRSYTIVAVWLFAYLLAPSTGAPQGQRDAPANALNAQLSVGPRPEDVYHPGETIEWYCILKNASGEPLQVATEALINRRTVFVRCPDGRILEQGLSRQLQRQPVRGHRLVTLQPGSAFTGGYGVIHLSDSQTTVWRETGTGDNAPSVNLRTQGRYEVWVSYSLPPLDPAEETWSGTVQTNRVSFEVVELPPERRHMQPTAEQAEALERLLFSEDPKIVSSAYRQLSDAVALTENEGLAIELIRAARRNPQRAEETLQLVRRRARVRASGAFGIDGPYLRELAELMLDAAERPGILPSERGRSGWFDMFLVIEYLRRHRADAEQLRARAVPLARRSAFMPDFPEYDSMRWSYRFDDGQGPLHIGLSAAWTILADEGVLYEGMTLAEAEQVLGPPTERRGDRVIWTPRSMLRMAPPAWGARLENGRLFDLPIR